MTSAYTREQILQYLEFIQLGPPIGWDHDRHCRRSSTEDSGTGSLQQGQQQQQQEEKNKVVEIDNNESDRNNNNITEDSSSSSSKNKEDRPRNPNLTLSYLTALHVHQISTIPYENLSLHYSRDKQVDLEPAVLFDKFLRKGRGGYCLETSLFYNHVLRALGFQVYTAAVRIRLRRDGVPFGPFAGWRHIVNVVTLPDPDSPTGVTKYMVDVGFGGDGATKPLALIHDRPQQNLGTQSIRLIHDTIEDLVDRSDSQKLWVFQYRNGDDKPWNSYYAFPEVEYTPYEFDTLNFWLVNHVDSFQRQTMLIIKFVRGKKKVENGPDHVIETAAGRQEQEQQIIGKLMLVDGKVKRNMGGRTELVAELKTEPERIAALKEWFGLVLRDEEVDAIAGHVTELGVDRSY